MQPNTSGFSLKNLSVQFNLIVIGIPTLVLMAFGLYQLKIQTIAFEQNLEEKLRNEASQLSASLSTALFNFDDETCQVICKAALNKPEIIKITIRDQTEIYQSFATEAYMEESPEGGTRVVNIPITFKDERIGALEVIATTKLMRQRLAAMKKSILLQILIVDIVLGFVMAFVLLLRFIRPLKALEKESARIAAGDLEYPITVSRSDEIGVLAANLLTMRDAVREKMASLESEAARHEKTSTKLKKTKGYIDNILNSMPSMLIAVDPDLKITQWNIRAEEITGIPSASAVGQSLPEMVPDLAPLADNIRNTIESKEIHIQTRKLKSAKEGMGYEDIAVYPLISEYVDGAVIRIDDVTEHVKMEEMVVQSEKMMSVGGLAAGMAHEINNPLAGMMQNAQVVMQRISQDMPASISAAKDAGTTLEAIREFMVKRGITRQLESIHHAGVRASQIVQNMLSFSRQDYSGKSMQQVDQILDMTLELARSDYDLKKQYDFKAITVEKTYEKDLPAVLCEASKLQQVFFNILKNCAEAMQDKDYEKAGETPVFELKVGRSGAHILVEIADNGPGMPEDIRKRIFEPFFTTKPVGKGTGLGLSVAYFIITDNHKGKLNVISAPGKGSRFMIHLPMN